MTVIVINSAVRLFRTAIHSRPLEYFQIVNSEISRTQRQVMDLYQKQRDYLGGKPRQFVLDLHHDAQELRFSNVFSVRTAAEINYTASEMVLEASNQPTHNPS